MLKKPEGNQYPEYFQKYVNLVPDGDIIEILKTNKEKMISLLSGLTDKQAEHRYAEGKWSIKDILGHINDTERIFAYRALRMGRNDKTNIPQYDHDAYVAEAKFDNQKIADLVENYKTVREATISLVKSFDENAWERIGLSGGKEFITKCFPFIIAGHELHHLGIIKERYLPGV